MSQHPALPMRRLAPAALLLALACGARAQTAAAATEPATPPASELAAAPVAGDSLAGTERPFRVRVTEPYLDLRTQAGRGYPVFFAVARGEWVTVLRRHTDWYRVRAAGGQQGWVTRAQLASTLTEDGTPMRFTDPSLDDYLQRRFDVGLGYGASNTASMIRFWAGVRVSDTLSLELQSSKVQAASSDTNLWHVNLLAEPWSDQRLSPFVGVGVGKYHYVPGKSLVDQTVYDSRLGVAMAGLRYHLAGRVALRVDYSLYTAFVSDSRTKGYQALTAGLSLFF